MLPDVGPADHVAALPACGPHHVAADPDGARQAGHQRRQAAVAVWTVPRHGDPRLGGDPPRDAHVAAGAVHPSAADGLLGQVQEPCYPLPAYLRDGALGYAPLAHGARVADVTAVLIGVAGASREGHGPQQLADVPLLALELLVGLGVGLPQEHEVLVERPDGLVPGGLGYVDP